jgi:hypothetical protein
MTIQPVLTCALGIGLASLFELAYCYVDKHWSTPAGKECWAGAFWLLVVTVLVQSKMMPTNPPGISPWFPFIAVGAIHILMVLDGDGFSRLPWTRPPYPPNSNPPTQPADSNGQESRDVKKTKPNNNNQDT